MLVLLCCAMLVVLCYAIRGYVMQFEHSVKSKPVATLKK